MLKRHIGLGALALYGIGDILGAGVYGLIGRAAGELGNAVWLAFVVSGLIAGLTGLTYASLGSRYPVAGGAAYISERAFGSPFVSYVLGLAVLMSGLTSIGAACKIFAGYLVGIWPVAPLAWVAIAFVLVIASIVFRGIKESMWVNVVLTLIEASGLLFVIAMGFGYIGSVDYFDVSTAIEPKSLGLPLIMSGAVLTFYSFVGFEDIMNVAEEVKDPETTLPRGLLIAVAVSCIIYLLISLIAVAVVPAGELAQSSAPLLEVVKRTAPWFPIPVYGGIAMVAVSNTALLNFVMGSRLVYGMARQGLLPRPLAKLHPRTHTPHVAILAILVLLLILATTVDIAALAKSTSLLLLSSFSVMNVALIVLKRRKSEPKGRFEVPYFVPGLSLLLCLTLLTFAGAPELKVAGFILAGILVLYAIARSTGHAKLSGERPPV